MLYRSILEEESNSRLFDFIFTSVTLLDEEEYSSLFHPAFILELTRYLGFYPAGNYREGSFFDLKEGVFSSQEPSHPLKCGKDASYWLSRLMQEPFPVSREFNIPADVRREIISRIVDYYALHIAGFGEINSLGILEKVFG
jgi:DNA repair protein RecO (recombination protein O)